MGIHMIPRWMNSRSTLERGRLIGGKKRFTLAFSVIAFVKILALAFAIFYAARMLLGVVGGK